MGLTLGIRAYVIDDCVMYLYEEWRKLLGDRVFIFADETRGPVNVGKAPKISWTNSDAANLGLPLVPAKKVPWYNGDYHIYHMIPHMDPDDFCILVEHDVYLEVSDRDRLLDVLLTCAEHDFVASRIGPRPPQWKWGHDMQGYYDGVQGALITVVGFNRKSAEHLLARRVALAERRARLGLAQWPFVEAFVGTELCAAGNLKIGDLVTLGGLTRAEFRTTPPFLFEDLIATAPPDRLYHPCLPRDRFLRRIVPLFRFATPTPQLWKALWPFVSTASQDEMAQMDRLAEQFWGTPSFLGAFAEERPAVASGSQARGD